MHNKNQKVESSIPRSWSSNVELKNWFVVYRWRFLAFNQKPFNSYKWSFDINNETIFQKFSTSKTHCILRRDYVNCTLSRFNQRRPLMTLFCPSGIFTHLGIKTLFFITKKACFNQDFSTHTTLLSFFRNQIYLGIWKKI